MLNTALTWLLAVIPVLAQAQGSTPTLASPKPTPSQSTTTSTTATVKKPSNTGEIFRWVDAKGRVQYGADVPEEYAQGRYSQQHRQFPRAGEHWRASSAAIRTSASRRAPTSYRAPKV
jgi:hypothetical protein